MADSSPSTVAVGKTPPAPATAGTGDWQSVVRPHGSRPAPDISRRQSGRATVGFWLGGVVLGAGGCILGACMPYHRPVAVIIGVLWWGTYLGCLGASLGALFGLLSNRTPACFSQGRACVGNASPALGGQTTPRRTSDAIQNRGDRNITPPL